VADHPNKHIRAAIEYADELFEAGCDVRAANQIIIRTV